MRKKLTALLAFPLFAFAMGEKPPADAFIPAKIVDRSGTEHEVSALLCDDKAYFEFRDGSVVLKVPFGKVKRLVVLGAEGDRLKVEVYFTDGGKRSFLIDPDVECSGPTPYGTLEAYLSQIREITFKNP